MANETLDDARIISQNKCPVCDGHASLISNMKTINPHSNETVDLMTCKLCAHWFHSPLPKQDYLMELYGEGSKFVAGDTSYFDNNFNEKYFQKVRKFVTPSWITGKFNYLEIGVGNANLFKYMSKFSNTSIGVEPGIWSPDNKSLVSSIDSVPTDHKFDIIVLFDVLEHVTEPLGLLKDLRSRASNNAYMSVTVPNSESFAAKFLQSRWAMVRPVGHLHYFSKLSLEKTFKDSGWEVHKISKQRDRQKSLFESLKNIRTLKPFIYTALFGRDQWLIHAKPTTDKQT